MYIVKSEGMRDRKFLTFKNAKYYLEEVFGDIHYMPLIIYGEWVSIYDNEYNEVAKLCAFEDDE
jgi:hypothetical protein